MKLEKKKEVGWQKKKTSLDHANQYVMLASDRNSIFLQASNSIRKDLIFINK